MAKSLWLMIPLLTACSTSADSRRALQVLKQTTIAIPAPVPVSPLIRAAHDEANALSILNHS